MKMTLFTLFVVHKFYDLFHDGGPYHVETSLLIALEINTRFYMMRTYVMKKLRLSISSQNLLRHSKKKPKKSLHWSLRWHQVWIDLAIKVLRIWIAIKIYLCSKIIFLLNYSPECTMNKFFLFKQKKCFIIKTFTVCVSDESTNFKIHDVIIDITAK